MAARLTDKQKKKIVADYVELGSYNATAKLNGVSLNTVKHIVQANAEIAEMCNQKKEETPPASWTIWTRRRTGYARSSA